MKLPLHAPVPDPRHRFLTPYDADGLLSAYLTTEYCTNALSADCQSVSLSTAITYLKLNEPSASSIRGPLLTRILLPVTVTGDRILDQVKILAGVLLHFFQDIQELLLL